MDSALEYFASPLSIIIISAAGVFGGMATRLGWRTMERLIEIMAGKNGKNGTCPLHNDLEKKVDDQKAELRWQSDVLFLICVKMGISQQDLPSRHEYK